MYILFWEMIVCTLRARAMIGKINPLIGLDRDELMLLANI